MGMWQEDPYPMFSEQLPRMLMAITMLTVPWMLIPKPIVLAGRMNKQNRPPSHGMSQDVELLEDAHVGEHHDVGEMVIHQVIETIEYVLGTVSHTASYLRLWALSLAHQQLSLVFFEKTLLTGMSIGFPGNVF